MAAIVAAYEREDGGGVGAGYFALPRLIGPFFDFRSVVKAVGEDGE